MPNKEILAETNTQVHSLTPGEKLIAANCQRRPVLDAVLHRNGEKTLEQYAAVMKINEAEPIEDRSDLVIAVRNQVTQRLGAEMGEKVGNALIESTDILTGNHTAPELAAITLHGDIVYALSKNPESIAPIFTFSIIPLNNLVYARGLSPAHKMNDDGKQKTIKASYFPVNMSETLVYAAPAVTKIQIENAIFQVQELELSRVLSGNEAQTMRSILEEDFLNESVLRQPDYSSQLSVVNHKIWNRLFTEEARRQLPDVAFLEIESIVGELLQKDLRKKDSLMYTIFFNPHVRNGVMERLDKQYSCWNRSALHALTDPTIVGNDRRKIMSGAGTEFFWGIDKKGRRIPLHLAEYHGDSGSLIGLDDSGAIFSLPFTSESLLHALEIKKIVPSLFTSFVPISFARGFKAEGGFMQTDYLTVIKQGLTDVLYQNGYEEWSRKIQTVSTENYITGMTVAVVHYQDGTMQPAGAIEIIGNGGLTTEDLEKVRHMTVKETNMLAQPDIYNTIYHPDERDRDLSAITATDIAKELGEKIIQIKI